MRAAEGDDVVVVDAECDEGSYEAAEDLDEYVARNFAEGKTAVYPLNCFVSSIHDVELL